MPLVTSKLSHRHYTSPLSQVSQSISVYSFEALLLLFHTGRKAHVHRSFLVFQNSSKTATTLLQRPLYRALSNTCHVKLTSDKNRVGKTTTNTTFTFFRHRVLYQFGDEFEVCSEWEHIKEYSRSPDYMRCLPYGSSHCVKCEQMIQAFSASSLLAGLCQVTKISQ